MVGTLLRLVQAAGEDGCTYPVEGKDDTNRIVTLPFELSIQDKDGLNVVQLNTTVTIVKSAFVNPDMFKRDHRSYLVSGVSLVARTQISASGLELPLDVRGNEHLPTEMASATTACSLWRAACGGWRVVWGV